MKKIALVFIIMVLAFSLSACKTNIYPKIDSSYVDEFSIKEDKYLMVDDKYYVQKVKTSYDMSGGKDIGIICKNDKTNALTIEDSFENAIGRVSVINGLDIENRVIEINGENYKITEYENQFAEALNLNELFEELESDDSFTLNPENYTEFIDNNGTVYVLGKSLEKENIDFDSLLYPVRLGDEIITEITFNTETGLKMSAKDKATMLTDSEGAKKIRTIFYGDIYKTKDGTFAVETDGEYRELKIKK